MLCGTDSYMDLALKISGLSDRNVSRLRDAYFTKGNNQIVVVLFTRNGGGNR